MSVSINPSELKYKYSREAADNDNPKFRGPPDSILFHRGEEYEVIPMLERVMEELALSTKESAHFLEDLIKEKLPSNIRKREDVFAWLVKNFKVYKYLY